MESQDVIRMGCRRRIGDGLSTKIWKVPWLLCPDNGFLTTEVPDELRDENVQSLFDETQLGWDDDILCDILNERDRELVKQIPVSGRKREDVWFWLFDNKGMFTVKSCYRKLRGEAPCVEGEFWRKLWRLKLPGKVLNMIWRACRGCLPTVTALAGKRVQVCTTCSWCHGQDEDDIHVLFQCSFAREVWLKAGLSSLIAVEVNDTVFTIFKRVFQTCKIDQVLMISMLCWNLWQRRNSWVWNHVQISAFGVQSKAASMFVEWQRASENSNGRTVHHASRARQWCKPPAGWVKINTDAACTLGSNYIGVGCIIRDEWGNFVRARSNVVQGRFQPREAEAIGLKEALSWTKEWRSSKCIFECDAKLLVDAVNGSPGHTYFHAIVDECNSILKHFDEVLVLFVSRSANIVAHTLARATCSTSGLNEWVLTAPENIICMLDSEKL